MIIPNFEITGFLTDVVPDTFKGVVIDIYLKHERVPKICCDL